MSATDREPARICLWYEGGARGGEILRRDLPRQPR